MAFYYVERQCTDLTNFTLAYHQGGIFLPPIAITVNFTEKIMHVKAMSKRNNLRPKQPTNLNADIALASVAKNGYGGTFCAQQTKYH
jgi:hypothetical protein